MPFATFARSTLFTSPHRTQPMTTGLWRSKRRGTHLPMWYHSLAINKVLNHIFACWHRVSLSEELPPRKSPITLLWASENRLQKWVSVCMLYQVPNSLFPNLIDQLNREKLRTADGPTGTFCLPSILGCKIINFWWWWQWRSVSLALYQKIGG